MVDLPKRDRVFQVFQSISVSYDDANQRISLGMEKSWKEHLIKALLQKVEEGGAALDVCSGTGDIAIALASRRPDLRVVGLDFSPAMLEVARNKGCGHSNLIWQEGDAMALPFADNSFSAACISFGLRNTADYGRVLCEMLRVVRPGGWVYCLDSFVPDSPLIRPMYELYFRVLMPLLGGGFRHRQEYLWLWQSTQKFLRKDELLALFQRAGMIHAAYTSHLFGACVLHSGQKPIGTIERENTTNETK